MTESNFMARNENVEIKKCPHCHSVFLNENFCESCGRKKHFNPLGSTGLHPHSYFVLSTQRPRWWHIFYPEVKKRYVRQLVRRMKLFMDFFDESYELKTRERNYLLEMKLIVSEFIELGLSRKNLENYFREFQNKKIFEDFLIYWEEEKKVGRGTLGVLQGRKDLGLLLKGILFLALVYFLCLWAISFYPLELN